MVDGLDVGTKSRDGECTTQTVIYNEGRHSAFSSGSSCIGALLTTRERVFCSGVYFRNDRIKTFRLFVIEILPIRQQRQHKLFVV